MKKSLTNIKRVLILGHTGFVGSHLVPYFKKHLPEVDVIGVSSALADLTKKEETRSLKKLFDPYTIVIMCSAIKRQFSDKRVTFLKNFKMIMNICDILQCSPVKRFVFISSAAVYGEDVQNMDITETTNVQPTSYYGMAKYISECLLRKVFENQKQGSLLILRPPLIYGPGEKVDTYGPTGFIRTAIRKEKIVLWGDGREKREFIFIDDLVRIVYRLAMHNYEGVLTVASGENHSFLEVVKIISGSVPFKIRAVSQARTKKKVDHRYRNAGLMRILGNFTFTGIEKGIKETIAAEIKI